MDLANIRAFHPTWDADNGLLTVSFDHGKANEMGHVQLDAFEALCELVETNDAIRCLCSTSTRVSEKGKPIFIAGANVTERQDWSPAQVMAHVERQRALMGRLASLPLFHVVVVTGVALGWGTEYVLTADYAIATPQASFALPETGLGIVPGARGSAELAARVGPNHALRMGCLGEKVTADEAVRMGLVQELVDNAAAGRERVQRLAQTLMRRSPTAVAAFKHAVLASMGCSATERLGIEARAYAWTVESGEAAIGRAHFREILSGQAPTWGPRRRLL